MADENVKTFGENASSAQTSNPADYFSSITHVPVSKLDADQYAAEDIDGVTESLFGSGNLNFAMLQASQTNDMIASNSPFLITGQNYSSTGYAGSGVTFHSGSPTSGNDFSYHNNQPTTDTDRTLADDSGVHVDGHSFEGGFTHSTVGSLGVSGLAADRGTGLPSTGTNGFDGSGLNGDNGSDGLNGTDGDGTTIVEITDITNIDLGDILNNLNIDLGDFTLIDLGDVTNFLSTTINEISNIIDILNLTEITNNLTDIVNNFFSTIFGGDGGLTVHLDAILSEITDLDLDIISGDTVLNVVDQIIDLSPVTDLLDPVIDLDNLVLADLHSIISILDGPQDHAPGDIDLGLGIEGALGNLPVVDSVVDLALNPVEDLVGDIDILADLGFGLLDNSNIDNGAGDTDLTLGTDLDTITGDLLGLNIDVPLDPIEQITGDIDLDLGIGTDLLGDLAEGVDIFNGGSDEANIFSGLGDNFGQGVGDILHDILPGLDHDPTADVTSGGDLSLFGTDIAHIDDINLNLDPVEALTGDLDVHTDLGLDLLNSGDIDNSAGDTDLTLGLDFDGLSDGLPPVDRDIPLDPVESVVGDIDLDLGAAGHLTDDGIQGIGDFLQNLDDNNGAPDLTAGGGIDLMGSDVAEIPQIELSLDSIEPLTGDIDATTGVGLDLLGSSETDNSAGDTDLTTDIDIDLVGIELPDIDFVDVSLDPIENITGDIDLDINAAIDLLNSDPHDGGVGDLLGGNNPGQDILTAWPENVLPDPGDLFSGGGQDVVGALPEPVGHVAEGLGGLLGGQHHHHIGGGLFG